MTQTIERAGLTFVCEDPIEAWRVETIHDKEPGTVAWIETFQPGEVFYDIGANIGIYTLLAALQVGPSGSVFAVEPHLFNACALLQNISASGLGDRVTVIAHAMSAVAQWAPFHYRSMQRGSSGSQIERAELCGTRFAPAASEWKHTVTLDSLLVTDARPCHIKIDVDGHEAQILRGLSRVDRVRSIQVETEPAQRAVIVGRLAARGFHVDRVHYTANGQQAIDNGADPASVIHNTIFRRSDA